jgi:GPH family glycoside/pentoside/hexuronide:cation symporter
MAVVGVALASIGIMPDGAFYSTLSVAALAGIAIGGLDVIFPSIQADIIDYDELQTGERKEGTYFAVWHLAAKTSSAIGTALVGFLLAASGFVANAEQSPETVSAMRLLMSGIPLVCYGVGAGLFCFFRMTRKEHAAILTQLEARRAEQTASS